MRHLICVLPALVALNAAAADSPTVLTEKLIAAVQTEDPADERALFRPLAWTRPLASQGAYFSGRRLSELMAAQKGNFRRLKHIMYYPGHQISSDGLRALVGLMHREARSERGRLFILLQRDDRESAWQLIGGSADEARALAFVRGTGLAPADEAIESFADELIAALTEGEEGSLEPFTHDAGEGSIAKRLEQMRTKIQRGDWRPVVGEIVARQHPTQDGPDGWLLILHYDASSGSIGDRSLLLVEPTQNGPKIVGEAERDFLAAAFLSRRYDPDLDIEQLPRDEQLVKQTDRLIGLLKDGEVEALRDMFVDHHAWHGVEDLLVEIMQTREVEAHIGKVMVNHLYGKGISVLEWVMPEGSGLREPPALRLRWERTPEGWVIAGVAMPDRFFLWLATEGDPFEE